MGTGSTSEHAHDGLTDCSGESGTQLFSCRGGPGPPTSPGPTLPGGSMEAGRAVWRRALAPFRSPALCAVSQHSVLELEPASLCFLLSGDRASPGAVGGVPLGPSQASARSSTHCPGVSQAHPFLLHTFQMLCQVTGRASLQPDPKVALYSSCVGQIPGGCALQASPALSHPTDPSRVRLLKLKQKNRTLSPTPARAPCARA